MDRFLQRVVLEPFEAFLERLIRFLPSLLTSLLIFVAGIVIGGILRFLALRFFRVVNLDNLSQRFGIAEVFQKGGIDEPLSDLLAKILGWLTFFVFAVISLRALELPALEQLLAGFFFYLPNIFVAAMILFAGYLLSNFLGRAALIAAVNAGLAVSGIAGKLVTWAVFLLSVTMALEQLGIGRGTIVIAFSILFGGVVLALAIAFGLGGKDIARDYLEKKLKGEEKKDDIRHL